MLAWLRLLRVAGLFTIAGNLVAVVASTMAVSEPGLIGIRVFRVGADAWLVLASSVQLYCLGMLWNDIIDAERDRELHPERPLPSGAVNPVLAWIVGIVLASGAIVCASLIGYRGFYAAGVLLGLILLYDFGAKRIPWIGSMVMALIRIGHAVFLLLVLGEDFFDRAVLGLARLAGALPTDGPLVSVYPLILGVYVFGLTLGSEVESRRAQRWELLVAGTVMTGALVMAWAWAAWEGRLHLGFTLHQLIPPLLLAGLSGLWLWFVGRPWWLAVRTCERIYVGRLTAAGLGGLLLLDAMVAGVFSVGMALLLAGLLVPFLLLSRLASMD